MYQVVALDGRNFSARLHFSFHHSLRVKEKPHHVLSSTGVRGGTENCITAVAGVMSHTPWAQEPPFTGPHRGQAATDRLATAILEASGVAPNEEHRYEAPQDTWVVHALIRATPAPQSGIHWYTLGRY